MASVMLTDNHRFSMGHQIITTLVMLSVLAITLLLLLAARWIHRWIGDMGAGVVSRIMGMILAAIAVNSVLVGIKHYFLLP